MKHKIIVIFVCGFAVILLSACGYLEKTIEVTRIVPQTVMATQLVTQIVRYEITATPQATMTIDRTPTSTPTPKWTPDFSDSLIKIITPTPGILVIDNNSRPNVEQFISAEYINEYLVLNYGERSFGGKVFCGYQPIGMGNDGHTIKLYVWSYCAEYYLLDKEIKMGSASDFPVVLFVEIRNGAYKIVNTLDSGGGYELVKTNFPPEIQKIILDREHAPEALNQGTAALVQELKKEAAAYFGN